MDKVHCTAEDIRFRRAWARQQIETIENMADFPFSVPVLMGKGALSEVFPGASYEEIKEWAMK